jgi:hypothetical protein
MPAAPLYRGCGTDEKAVEKSAMIKISASIQKSKIQALMIIQLPLLNLFLRKSLQSEINNTHF